MSFPSTTRGDSHPKHISPKKLVVRSNCSPLLGYAITSIWCPLLSIRNGERICFKQLSTSALLVWCWNHNLSIQVRRPTYIGWNHFRSVAILDLPLDAAQLTIRDTLSLSNFILGSHRWPQWYNQDWQLLKASKMDNQLVHSQDTSAGASSAGFIWDSIVWDSLKTNQNQITSHFAIDSLVFSRSLLGSQISHCQWSCDRLPSTLRQPMGPMNSWLLDHDQVLDRLGLKLPLLKIIRSSMFRLMEVVILSWWLQHIQQPIMVQEYGCQQILIAVYWSRSYSMFTLVSNLAVAQNPNRKTQISVLRCSANHSYIDEPRYSLMDHTFTGFGNWQPVFLQCFWNPVDQPPALQTFDHLFLTFVKHLFQQQAIRAPVNPSCEASSSHRSQLVASNTSRVSKRTSPVESPSDTWKAKAKAKEPWTGSTMCPKVRGAIPEPPNRHDFSWLEKMACNQ